MEATHELDHFAVPGPRSSQAFEFYSRPLGEAEQSAHLRRKGKSGPAEASLTRKVESKVKKK